MTHAPFGPARMYADRITREDDPSIARRVRIRPRDRDSPVMATFFRPQ